MSYSKRGLKSFLNVRLNKEKGLKKITFPFLSRLNADIWKVQPVCIAVISSWTLAQVETGNILSR